MRKVPLGSSLLLARVVAGLRRAFLYRLVAFACGRRVIVRGPSMYPLLAPGERVLVDRLAYLGRLPERGDVALARVPGESTPLMLKLVVGLPGERVEIGADRLWINGAPFALPHAPLMVPLGSWQLGPEECFLLSYNASMGTDSRHFGPVPLSALRGRAWWVFWPSAPQRRLDRVSLSLSQPPAHVEDASPAGPLR
jgi:signal peptidase I